ncbi:hypothetical protein SADUNF_Sadunf11G0007900 [Salix dunnii]|uniref:PGG domain-containing protein n=1 Tax=Salix dunnii TaxID=1413687 RepID=A0A835JJ05_9ROSI|nr:hypothetical protein SADUNF_Sadunf11G0007900 [Salix dunnii]
MATINSLQSIPVPLPIFDGTDYDLWETKMKTLFKSQNLWDIVNEPQNTCISNEAQPKDASALYLIQQSLAPNIFRRIAKVSTAKDAWDMLRDEFLGDPKEATNGAAVEKTYGAAMEGKWEEMVNYYDQEHLTHICTPVTDSSENVLHLAVQSKKEQPLKKLLEIMKKRELSSTDETEFLKKTNKYGNTALHEATIYGNYEAVKLLVERCPGLVKMENNFGETPLFTAAGFAETKIVEFLIGSGLKQCLDDDGRLLRTHRKRTQDDLSILSAAIIGQKFETALLLLELDASLASLKDKNKITTLQLLAEMPTSAFECGSVPMGICERFIYSCLPAPSHSEVKSKAERLSQERKKGDLESGQGRYSSGDQGCGSEKNQRGGPLNYLKIRKGGWLERIWDEKRKHVFALAFAESLIEKDESLKVDVTKTEEDQNKDEENEEREMEKKWFSAVPSLTIKKEIPLFTATRRGIEKIVRLIIERHPHAIDKCDDMGRSILDVAVIYRQQKIFDIIVNEKEKEVPLARMRRVLDKSGNTLLHHVADIKKNSGVTKPGPALQLQEELKWFEQVEKVIPSHYVPLLNKEGKTARECFEIAHEEKLEKAQLWIKETSQSCSTVAALVSTVVFAAAYTVPGGSDEKGKPIFINSPYFLIFTVTDVVSLASSLTSLVMFLSLLTSPFELQEFHISLPRKLIVGLFFLFFSVLTSMISFGATILILIQTERELTTLLLSIASFLPVFLFGIMQSHIDNYMLIIVIACMVGIQFRDIYVAAMKLTLKNVTDYITNVICKRSDLGYNYRVILFPEDLFDFIPEAYLYLHKVSAGDISSALKQKEMMSLWLVGNLQTSRRIFMATINSLQSIPVPLPIFDGTDYGLWEKKMKTLFKSQNLWDIVKQGRNEPQNTCISNEAQRKDASALYLIQQSLAQNVFRRIAEASTAKEAWDLLKKEFIGDAKGENKSHIPAKTWDAAIREDWESIIDSYRDEEHLRSLSSPVTYTLDTVLHLAVHDKDGKQCEDLLEIVRKKQLSETEFLKKTNKYGNTALHEATINRNYKAVKLLVECCPDLITIKNIFGETPLFTAAGFAQTEIVEFLIGSGLKQCLCDDGSLLPIHRKRNDKLSILSVAIIGQNFETALLLLELDASLASLKDKNKITTLQLLAEMPTAFESGFPMGICKRFIYSCLPAPRHSKVKSKGKSLSLERKRMGDLECGLGRYSSVDHLRCGSEKNQRGGLLNYLKMQFFWFQGWLKNIRKQKRMHVFAYTLAESLVENDDSLNKVTIHDGDQKEIEIELICNAKDTEKTRIEIAETSGTSEIAQTSGTNQGAENSVTMSSLTTNEEMPLFTATRRGVKEIVELIIKLHPHAIEPRDKMKRSVLDMAVMYRQRKIFDIIVEGKKLPLARMRRVVDNSGNTMLHHVADMKKNSGVTKPGPALQLQEELKWFELVEKVIPPHYVPLLNKEGKTAKECFEIAHEEQLQKAQTWIKETGQSCSTVAALVSTVVFAAAYTVPGGSDEKGKPIFINSPYFLIFTVTDVISLASSLTSLVMFLSLLTSPFELQEFHTSLPRKLIAGLFFLFFSVFTTMISFGATILILIQTERKFTSLLLSIASFLPVLAFGIMQFGMFVSFLSSTLNIRKIKSSLVTCLPWGKKAPPRR